MNCNFHKSQKENVLHRTKICLSNILYLHKATECHGCEEQMKMFNSTAEYIKTFVWYSRSPRL